MPFAGLLCQMSGHSCWCHPPARIWDGNVETGSCELFSKKTIYRLPVCVLRVPRGTCAEVFLCLLAELARCVLQIAALGDPLLRPPDSLLEPSSQSHVCASPFRLSNFLFLREVSEPARTVALCQRHQCAEELICPPCPRLWRHPSKSLDIPSWMTKCRADRALLRSVA